MYQIISLVTPSADLSCSWCNAAGTFKLQTDLFEGKRHTDFACNCHMESHFPEEMRDALMCADFEANDSYSCLSDALDHEIAHLI